jgi:N-acetylglucosamine-6-sulfatase
VQKGITFTNSFVDFALCCPSRASFLTGQNAHNHAILDNILPEGGYEKFAPREGNSLGVWLQEAGYITGLVGKVMNGYGVSDPTHIVPGWTNWVARVDGLPGYYNYGLNENGVIRLYGQAPGDYSTDVLAQKAVDFIARQAPEPQPFFLLVATNAPHIPPVAAPRHAGDFASLPMPKSPNFNESDVSDKPGFIRDLPLLSAAQVRRDMERFRTRREALLAVDDLVRKIVRALATEGVLGDTIIIFTSDNGFSLGNHRWEGKRVLYEESIRVPLIMRGPGIPRNQTRSHLVTNLDVVATIIQRTGAISGSVADGRPLTPIILDPSTDWRTAFFLHGTIGLTPTENLHFRAVRSRNYIYASLQSDTYGAEEEFYDLLADPHELQNRISVPRYRPVIDYLRGLRATLSTCQGENCWVTGEPPPL